jgi:RNA polymerase sigma factor (sigma-70 family)
MASGALDRAYQAHHLGLVRLATLLVTEQAVAEDLVHDVFVRARAPITGMEEREVYPYLRRSVLNAWRNQHRHALVEERALPRLTPVPQPDPTAAVDDRQVLWHAIAALPERQRAVLVLRYYEDLPDLDIAQLLGCAQVTVRSQAKRALDKLREVVDR